MLEMAIVLPILVVTAGGILELGRVVMIYQIATNAVREASSPRNRSRID